VLLSRNDHSGLKFKLFAMSGEVHWEEVAACLLGFLKDSTNFEGFCNKLRTKKGPVVIDHFVPARLLHDGFGSVACEHLANPD
jgi:hypothetical protein